MKTVKRTRKRIVAFALFVAWVPMALADNLPLATPTAQTPKAGVKDYSARSHLQTEFMEEHEMLAPNISRTIYSDGSEIVANYSNADFVYKGKTVRSLNYALVD